GEAAALLGSLAASAGSAGADAVGRRAAWREADALLAAGRPAEASARLEALAAAFPRDPRSPRGRLALGRALRLSGQDDRAAATWRALWLERPDVPEGRAAGEALERWRVDGGRIAPPSGQDHLALAARLLENGLAREALAETERAAAAEPPADPDRTRGLRALAEAALGRLAQAEADAAALRTAPDASVRRTADLVLARAAARGGRTEEAMAAYRRVAASGAEVAGLPEWRRRDLSDEAAFLAAWLPYDAGNLGRAVGLLASFVRAHPRSRRAPDARWFAAWSLYRLGRRAEAARALARLSGTEHAAAALYWRARIAPAGPGRRALYRRAVAEDPEGWYGLLARERLGDRRAPDAPAPGGSALPEMGPSRWAHRLRHASAVLAFGMRDAALEELTALADSEDARAAAPLLAQLAAYAGDARLPFRMARDHLGVTRRTLRWSHPEAAAEILPAVRALGADPSLLLAIMRRESGFRAEARSHAGAQGLLQLVPPTAERLGAVLGLPPGADASLGDPERNVRLGAHYLALLTDRFAHPALVAAAYNAGPGAVASWAEERSGDALDAWVESIPFRETRQYVKIVLPVQAIYRELRAEPPAPIEPGHPVSPPRPGVAF
ncbi:MAG TPA: transglycosylase SLT domain-containing protein, partial [Anaeromyxobacteraceae bacterium]|nr:transglycosylase SLT domain-containing protein [Anaeromyxobacteraceae bacterium]